MNRLGTKTESIRMFHLPDGVSCVLLVLALDDGFRQHAENLVHHRGADERRVSARIEWRCDFYHIPSDEIQAS